MTLKKRNIDFGLLIALILFIFFLINGILNMLTSGERNEKNCEEKYEISKYENGFCFVELNGKYYNEEVYLKMINGSAKK